MMDVQYAPDLIEQAVWLAARRDPAAERALHADLDPIFEGADGDEREARFQTAFVRWFRRLNLHEFPTALFDEFPLARARIDRTVIRAAPRRKAESADLFVRGGDSPMLSRTLVIQLCPESLVMPEQPRDNMLRELMHVEDMLDESFAYERSPIDGPLPRQQVVRDRYRVLWDIHVEARLVRRGMLAAGHDGRLRRSFARAFTVDAMPPHAAAFDRVWRLERAAHADFLAWSKTPSILLDNRDTDPVNSEVTRYSHSHRLAECVRVCKEIK